MMELTQEGKRTIEKIGLMAKLSPDLGLRLLREITADSVKEVRKVTPIDSASMVSTVRDEIDPKGFIGRVIIGGMMALFSRAGKPRRFVNYACVFDAHSIVKTKEGSTTIGQIKVGDEVLTQTGEYHKVTEKYYFNARDKSALIDIETGYRKDRTHKITVTQDHKILVFRDGRNKWVKAGEIKYSDELYTMIKKDHKEGTKKKKICEKCNKVYTTQGKKYCSDDCYKEVRRSNKNPHIGSKRTKQQKENISNSKKEFYKIHPEKHINKILSQKGFMTCLEKQVKTWLDERQVKYIHQYKIGNMFCDFYLPKTNEVIEVDGAFWHQNQKKDIIRDKKILRFKPDVKITHLHFYDKRFTTNIDSKPLSNVSYVVCNPGTKSYINLEVFKRVKILKLTKWHYYKGGRRLYDLTIDKVHSFYCQGLIISNSFVEEGTSKQAGQHMLVRGVDASLVKKNSIAKQAFNSWVNRFK